MYRIAVCDDEAVFREKIITILNEKLALGECEIKEYSDGRGLLYDIEDDEYFDIIILDISMNNVDGVTAARAIREGTICSNSIIIFVTSYDADIPLIVDINPLAYVYKSMTLEELKPKIDKAISKLTDKHRKLEFSSNWIKVRVNIKDIMYIESYPRGINIYTKDNIYKTTTYRIGEVMEKIGSDAFVRCHRAFAVNINYISRMTSREIYLYSGKTLPVGRKYHSELIRERRM